MEALLEQEFDRISHYELMFFSEMSKDLFRLFGDRDTISERVALRRPDKTSEEEEKKEAAPVEEPEVKAELAKPMDLAAIMKAKKAAGKKDKKKGKKAPKADAPPAKAPATGSAAAAEKPQETKEERNKNDRKQLLKYVEALRQMKAGHIATCQDILL